MPRTLTTAHPAGPSTGHPADRSTDHRHRSQHRPPDLPLASATRHAVLRGPLPQRPEAESTAEDEVAALRGSDGLTDVQREALSHRYDVVVRTTS